VDVDFEVNLFNVALAVTNLLLWICFLLTWVHSNRGTARMQRQIADFRQQLLAVEYGSFGVGKSLLKLEEKTRMGVGHNSVDQNYADQNYAAYKEAASLLQDGADAAYLVNKLGMSRTEADLVALLHPHLNAADKKDLELKTESGRH
jgi:hypothetical protein